MFGIASKSFTICLANISVLILQMRKLKEVREIKELSPKLHS